MTAVCVIGSRSRELCHSAHWGAIHVYANPTGTLFRCTRAFPHNGTIYGQWEDGRLVLAAIRINPQDFSSSFRVFEQKEQSHPYHLAPNAKKAAGAAPTTTLLLASESVSRRHAVIERSDGYYIEDDGSPSLTRTSRAVDDPADRRVNRRRPLRGRYG
jgi:hypothetical protein